MAALSKFEVLKSNHILSVRGILRPCFSVILVIILQRLPAGKETTQSETHGFKIINWLDKTKL